MLKGAVPTPTPEILALAARYQLGGLDLLTLLDTQRTVIQSQQRYYDTLRIYYHALIEMERVLGQDLVFE